jgi:hypothetical protein
MTAAVEADGGRIVPISPAAAWRLHLLRKPWNAGRYELRPQAAPETVRAYVPGGLTLEPKGDYLTVSEMPGKDWPPREIPVFLGAVKLVPKPEKMAQP